MATTYDVRIWKTETYKGKRRNTHYVRWSVAGQPRKKPFESAALADSFRSGLVSAARKGEPFDIDTGLPGSMVQTAGGKSCYAFFCEYVDAQWPRVAATTRRTIAEVLTTITVALLTTERGKPDGRLLRGALCRWAYNTNRRDADDRPAEVRAALRWVEGHTQPLSALRRPEVLRPVLDHMTLTLAGTPSAPTVVNRRRAVFHAALEYAVERSYLPANPLHELKWRPPKAVKARAVQAVERRRVANPLQVRTLLEAVREQRRSGQRLVAFFGCLYFAALRPEEAAALTADNLALPEHGWGELHLDAARPHAGRDWTDDREHREQRQLKHRARGETRSVPCPPELTALLRAHLDEFGSGPGGRLFVGSRNSQELPKLTILRVWNRARERVFTPEAVASPLAATPYDLRHAAVSGWLNAGVPASNVAEWAGHSVEVLLKTYAKCIDGGLFDHRRRIERFLGDG